jgi:hypothetical protein
VVNDELKSLLNDEVWHSYQVRLTAFAFEEIKAQFWKGKNTGQPLDGKDPADFASEALIDVLMGDEPWDSTRYKLRSHLYFVVRKKIYNAARRHDATHVFHADNDEELSNVTVLFPFDGEVESEDLIERFLKFLDGEDDLQLLIHCMRDGSLKRREIAQSLGLTPDQVTNLGKRLHRKAQEFQKQAQATRKKSA